MILHGSTLTPNRQRHSNQLVPYGKFEVETFLPSSFLCGHCVMKWSQIEISNNTEVKSHYRVYARSLELTPTDSSISSEYFASALVFTTLDALRKIFIRLMTTYLHVTNTLNRQWQCVLCMPYVSESNTRIYLVLLPQVEQKKQCSVCLCVFVGI